MKTVGMSDEVHKELMGLKINYGYKRTDHLLEEMIREFKKEKLLEASEAIRERMARKKMSLKQLMERSRKAREEIYNEWFH